MASEWEDHLVARLGDASADEELRCHRTAKQSLCALIKSFGVPVSRTRDCVTSYARGLEEFDAKGNRPNAESLAVFERTRAAIDEAWRKAREQRRSTTAEAAHDGPAAAR